jgi:hypothetical protein
MIDHLADRGFGYGSGLLSPDQSRFIVNIPKNASSYLLDWTGNFGWSTSLAPNCDGLTEIIVVLRDPVQRWISGMAQYLKTYILCPVGPNGPVFPGMAPGREDYAMSADDFVDLYNDLVERLIFDVVFKFDDHVWTQHDFFKDIYPAIPRTYFLLDENFNKKFADHLKIGFVDGLDSNSGDDNPDQKKINEFLKHRLNTRPELIERVQRAYARDYKIIQQAFKS